jgi:6,7-dimethyl-8-ribityllumazine synthase
MARANESLPGVVDPVEPGTRIATVVSAYHTDITGMMSASARETLLAAGVAEQDLLDVQVPGAFELPIVALRLARRDDVHAVLCFGLVLRGETPHDRYISAAVAEGLMKAGLETNTPILFGVLTCETLEQAQARARRAADGGQDKGREVACAAVEVLRSLREASGAPRARRETS